MRVITGKARGRKLNTLPSDDIVRPTSDRVKEAMFSIIQFRLNGASVLDLFAGSGQLGIEAISRGAEKATFVDASKAAIEVVKENLKSTGLFAQANVMQADSFSYLATAREKFDVILLDPPYRKNLVADALPAAVRVCKADGIILCETDAKEDLPETVGNFKLTKTYKYSNTKLTTYMRDEGTEE